MASWGDDPYRTMPRRAFSASTTASPSRLEDVFLQRYGWLRTRALALVWGRPRRRGRLRVSAAWVDQLLSTARSEARLFLRDPEEDVARISLGEGDDDLLVSLRRTILTAREGTCLSEDELAEWESAATVSVERQRHMENGFKTLFNVT